MEQWLLETPEVSVWRLLDWMQVSGKKVGCRELQFAARVTGGVLEVAEEGCGIREQDCGYAKRPRPLWDVACRMV